MPSGCCFLSSFGCGACEDFDGRHTVLLWQLKCIVDNVVYLFDPLFNLYLFTLSLCSLYCTNFAAGVSRIKIIEIIFDTGKIADAVFAVYTIVDGNESYIVLREGELHQPLIFNGQRLSKPFVLLTEPVRFVHRLFRFFLFSCWFPFVVLTLV